MFDRRTVLAGGAAFASALTAAAPLAAAKKPLGKVASPSFPQGFLWGASTAPHQIEGNNTTSDLWYLEHQQPTVFQEPSGDAANSFLMWERDLDLAKAIGLNTYRFGVEWARIEPAKGQFSEAMLGHYRRSIEGCRARGLAPVVTYSHFSAPLWFSAQGGWTNPESAELFARYCTKVTQAMGAQMHSAITLQNASISRSKPRRGVGAYGTARPDTIATWRETRPDLDVTGILQKTMNMDDAGEALLDCIVRTADGELTAAEILGHREFSLTRLYESA